MTMAMTIMMVTSDKERRGKGEREKNIEKNEGIQKDKLISTHAANY